jgi:phosphate transport system substrate-binding protein
VNKLLTILLTTLAITTQAQVTGAGSSFAGPLYSKWASEYNKETGITINYQPVGSGAGMKQIEAKTVDFAGTDDPVGQEEIKAKGYYQFPTAVGGVVPVINIKGIEAGKLVLDGRTLADIFQRKITNWNDSAIAKLNPGLTLPDQAITLIVRSDASGTTAVFTDFLCKVNKDFKKNVGTGKTVIFGKEGITASKGNAGIATYVQQLPGSIGYVEYAYVKQAKMNYVVLKNRKGQIVQPDDTTFAISAKSANWDVPGMAVDLNNLDGWPITSATFVVVYVQGGSKTNEVAKFFYWAFTKGDKIATDLDYLVLPDKVKGKIRNDWTQLK